jgi:glutamate-1-semialdehyde 2,1-aminomutase
MSEVDRAVPQKISSAVDSCRLRNKSHSLIPGGAHTYAKGDDQFPERAPAFIVRGKGCHVWDLDGNEFIEYGMGLRSVTLGHAFGPVVDAAYQQMQLGSNFTRPATIEVDYAEELLSVLPNA